MFCVPLSNSADAMPVYSADLSQHIATVAMPCLIEFPLLLRGWMDPFSL